jgi:hypothetical protein
VVNVLAVVRRLRTCIAFVDRVGHSRSTFIFATSIGELIDIGWESAFVAVIAAGRQKAIVDVTRQLVLA